MANKPAKKAPPKKAPRVCKRDLWLKAYLDSSNPSTFLNKTESARAAGYKTTNEDSLRAIGHENFTKLSEKITNWLNETGLSENALKLKLISLMEAKETKFQTLKGDLDPDKSALGVSVLSVASQDKYNNVGVPYTETDTLIGIEVENKELQRRTLDMALKVQGSYAPEKHDHSVKGEVRYTHEEALSRALAQKARALKGGGDG